MDVRAGPGPPPAVEADGATIRAEAAGPREHTVLPTDTLAGIALRYGVAVADVRRANGLLADNGIFSRRTLSIPPPGGLAPPGPALATLAGMIVAGYGTGGGGGAVGGGERRGQAPPGGPGGGAASAPASSACCSSGGSLGGSPARPCPTAAAGRRVGSEVELTALAGSSARHAAAGGDARLGGAGAETLRRRRGGGGSAGRPHPSPPGPLSASAAPSPARPTQ